MLLLVLAMWAGLVQGAEPRLLQRVEAEYPQLARTARVQGTVRLSVEINPDGSVRNATVVAGHAMLNEAAIRAAQQWKYSASPFGGTANIEIPFTIPVSPTGTLTGRVLDEEGRPISGILVTPRVITYENGHRYWAQSLSSVRTDQEGNYRLSLTAPRDYYVMAMYEVPPSAADGAESFSPQTFHPGTPDPLGAAAITVRPKETSIADIRVPRMKTLGISGTIYIPVLPEPNSAAGRPVVPRLSVRLSQEDPQFLSGAVGAESTILEGRNEVPFDFRGVRPGRYRIVATVVTGPPNWVYSGTAFIDVRENSVEGVSLALHRNIEFNGRIVSEDTTLALDQLLVQLLGRGPDAAGGVFPASADGAFRLFNLPEETYSVEVRGPLGDSYVGDIRIGGISIYADGFFSVKDSPPEDLQIVLKSNGGTVRGVVQNARREPMPGAYVALVPDGARRANHLFYRSGKAGDSGAFEFRGLQPGEYKVFAFEAAPPPGAVENAEFISMYEQRGVRVPVRDGVAVNDVVAPAIPRP